jgi:hypothetical protein
MTAIDTALASLTIVKTIKYKGADEVYGNTYFFDGTKPASDASWKTLADAVIAEEKVLFPSDVFITSAIGHQAGQSVAVWGYDYLANSAAVAGTYSIGTEYRQAGNVAAWLRWSTTQKTSKGKPIFLRSYFHPAFSAGIASTNVDTISSTWKTALEEYGADWIAGFADGDSVVHHRAGPHGAVGQIATASSYLTTRTLERRGKRTP